MNKIKDFFADNWQMIVAALIVLIIAFFGIDFLAGEKQPDWEGTTIVVDKETKLRTSTTRDKEGNRHTQTHRDYYIYFQDIDEEKVSFSRYSRVKVGDTVKYRTWFRKGRFTGINYNENEIMWR